MKKQILILTGLCLLFTAGGLIAAFWTAQPVSPDRVAQNIQENLVHVLNTTVLQTDQQLNRIKQGKPLSVSDIQFLLLNDEKILEWSDNHFIPPVYTLSGQYKEKYVKLASGDFILTKRPVDSIRNLITVIPLHIQYKISNNYLPPYWHPGIFHENRVRISQPESDGGYPIMVSNQAIFKIHVLTETTYRSAASVISVFFFLIAIISLIVLLVKWIRSIARENALKGFLMLMSAVVLIRMAMILLRFPFRFSALLLFDPKDFASSQFNPSMGDMILNALSILFLCFYLFKNFERFVLLKSTNWIVTSVSSLGIFFAILYPSVVTQTIYNNSAITLSISQSLDFSVLRISAFLLIVIAWLSAFLFVHILVKVLTRNERVKQIGISVVIGFLTFIVINEFTGQVYFIPALLAIVYLIIVLSFSIYDSLTRFQYITFVYFFFSVFCFSLTTTASIAHFENLRKAKDQQRFAENFLVEHDYFGEYLMREAADKIVRDAFIQNRLANPLLGKEAIKHKIKQVSLSGYFNRYTVDIVLYDQAGIPFPEESDTISFNTLFKNYNLEQFKTDYRNVFYALDAEDKTSKKYSVLIPVKRGRSVAGYVRIDLSLKRIIPENVYPELLVDNRFQQGYQSQALSYAVISGSRIEFSAGTFNYEPLIGSELVNRDLYSKSIIRDGYLHMGVEDVSGRVAIVSSVIRPFIHYLADFSFLILLGISAVLVYLLLEGITRYSGTQNLYFSARIQLILNLAFFVPLVMVCVVTLGLTSKSSQTQLKEDFLNKTNQFAKTIAVTMKSYNVTGNTEEFENEFKNITTLANLDANLYSVRGELLTTSQPLIFENQLISTYIDPSVFRKLKKGETTFVATDHVGSLEFYVAYSKVLSPDTGEMLGILGIPFFQSGISIEQMQITVLTNIISIFTLIFIVLLIISFFVTKWLTAPLTMITQTFGSISLTNANRHLEWKSDDEIGLMVREYNHMLDTLSNSKYELEKNQREKAWREIAQQVAHEIKNPLTPMKLTLQQLERLLKNENHPNDKLEKSVQSLLSQINSLDDLASSFSSFAKMPEPVLIPLNLVQLLSRIANLHAQEGIINFKSDLQNALILADDKLLGRIFSNIILNGFQSVSKDRIPVVNLRLEINKPYYSVIISDNGTGIEPDLIDKIFLPHFTTKKTGSGLGLAIAKQGIEQMGGKISFKTSSQGTTFTIDMPQNT